MHYDHCGNYDLFPQRALSRPGHRDGLRHRPLHVPPAAAHSVQRERRGRDGAARCSPVASTSTTASSEIAPGITVHQVGGHAKGLQSVRVKTKRGYVVLASDACHLYSHIDEGRVFPTTYNRRRHARGLQDAEEARDLAPPHRAGPRSGGAEALSGGERRAGGWSCGSTSSRRFDPSSRSVRTRMRPNGSRFERRGEFTPTPIPRTHCCGARRCRARSSRTPRA